VRHLVERDGSLYVVTGPVLAPTDSRTWNGTVEIPAATWKAVYDPAAGAAAAWVCTNTKEPVCRVVSIARLATIAGVDAFPALSTELRATPPRYERRSQAPTRCKTDLSGVKSA
jgi:endonuclease G, mitochondrial